MKRSSILLATALALVLAACGGDGSATSSATPTTDPTPTTEPTPEATASPETTDAPATDDGSGSGATGALEEALPATVGGLARQEIPGMGDTMEQLIASQLQQQGLGDAEIDFAWGMYGEGELIVTAFSVPGMPDGQLETLARLLSGMQVEGAEDLEAESVTLGGKEVLRMTTAGQPQSVFLYVSDGAMFSVVAETEELAEELLSQLP